MVTNTDDRINLSLILHPNGWGTCYIHLGHHLHELTMSFIFGDPLTDLINTMQKLIQGENEMDLLWHDEPGGHWIQINRQKDKKHLLIVQIAEFAESYEEEIKEFKTVCQFEIKEKLLLTHIYFELKKIKQLLTDKHYANNRQEDFPFQRFDQFEKEVLNYFEVNYGIKP